MQIKTNLVYIGVLNIEEMGLHSEYIPIVMFIGYCDKMDNVINTILYPQVAHLLVCVYLNRSSAQLPYI